MTTTSPMIRDGNEEPAPLEEPKPTSPIQHGNRHSSPLRRKLLDIMKEMKSIGKHGHNKEQGYNYIEQGDIVAKLREMLPDKGIYLETHWQKDFTIEERVNNRQNKYQRIVAFFTFVFVDVETGEYAEFKDWPGEAHDYSDKAINKASTAAQKYFLIREFLISDRDPDQDSAGDSDKDTPPTKGKKDHRRTKTEVVDRTWEDVVINFKSSMKGKRIGDLSNDQMIQIKTDWIDKTDWTKPRNKNEIDVRNAIITGIEARGVNAPDTRSAAAKVRQELANANITEDEFCTAVNKMIAGQYTKLGEIDEDRLDWILGNWSLLEAEVDALN